jgi:hypothetical protein
MVVYLCVIGQGTHLIPSLPTRLAAILHWVIVLAIARADDHYVRRSNLRALP